MQFSTVALISSLLAIGAQATVTSSVTATVSSVYTETVTSCGSEVTNCPASSAPVSSAPSSTLDAYGTTSGTYSSAYPSSTLDSYGSTSASNYTNATHNGTAAIQTAFNGASGMGSNMYVIGAAFLGAAVLGL